MKQLMQIITMVPGQVGGFNQRASPNSSPLRDCILKMLLGHWGGGFFLL